MPLAAGTRLGGYEIVGPLGGGGMGEVYRARDSRLGREVAIKLLPDEFSKDPARVARFEREARLLASINHPAIAAIYGAEESGDKRYLVLELVPGETLKDRLDHPLPLKEALTICRQIAEGLEAAHEKGIVHRDLKPANVMVTPQGKVKVLDLGLAKAMDVSASPEDLSQASTAIVDETLPGVILGTVGYMSPEQARGKPIDKRTDIWAFGCILFECLTGHRAFSGGNVSDVIASILRSEPKWPDLPDDTPPDIRELLGRCLEKDPSQRLRDIGDARIAIENNLSSSAGATRLWSTPPKRATDRRWILAAAALAALAAAAWWLGRVQWRSGEETLRSKYLAVLPFKDLSGIAGGQLIGDGMAETISVRLAKLPGIQVVAAARRIGAAEEDRDDSRIAKDLGANIVLSGSIQRSGNRVRITYSIWNASGHKQIAGDTLDGTDSDLFEIQDRLAFNIGEALKVSGGQRTTPRSGLDTAGEQDRYLRAVGELQRFDQPASLDAAIALLEGLASEKPSSALVQAALGRAYLHRYETTHDRKWIDQASAACRRALELEPESPEVHTTIGNLNLETGRAPEAIADYRKALAEQPNSFEATLGLARAYEKSGNLPDAERTFRRAIDLQPLSWNGYNKLGVFYFNHARYSQAADMFRKVIEKTPNNVRGYYSLGATYQEMEKFKEAEAAYLKSISIGPNAAAYSNLGTLYFDEGRYSAAADAFEKAVGLSPKDSVLWTNLGDAERWTPGRRAEATKTYEHAIELAKSDLAVNADDVSSHRTLAICFAKIGRCKEAEAHMSRALEIDPADTGNLVQGGVVSNLCGNRTECIRRIRLAVASGYSVERIRREPEFESLRRDPAFEKALSGKSPGAP